MLISRYLQFGLNILLVPRDGGGGLWSRHLLGPCLLEHHLIPEHGEYIAIKSNVNGLSRK